MRNVEYTERLYMILFISFKIHDKQTLKQPNVYIYIYAIEKWSKLVTNFVVWVRIPCVCLFFLGVSYLFSVYLLPDIRLI